jgi:hypothetical protein
VVSGACWACTVRQMLPAQRWLAAAVLFCAGVGEALHATGSCDAP